MSEEVAQVRRYLAEIPELDCEVANYLIPGSAPIDPTNVRGTTIFRIPISAEVFDLLNRKDKELDDLLHNRTGGERRVGVLPTLGMWVSLVYAELEDMGVSVRECCRARQHTVAGECDWLGEYAPTILDLHDDFFRDIELLWIELRRACRVRPEYIPKCPKCRNTVEGVYGSEADKYPAWWRCTGCQEKWVHDAEVSRLASLQPKMTLRQISAWLDIPLRTLHNWRKDGRFSTDRRGYAEVEHVKRAAATVGRIAVPA